MLISSQAHMGRFNDYPAVINRSTHKRVEAVLALIGLIDSLLSPETMSSESGIQVATVSEFETRIYHLVISNFR